MLFSAHVGGGEWIVTHDADGIGGRLGFNSGFVQLAEQCVEMRGITSGDVEIASGHGSGDDEGSRLDAVRNDAMLRTFQFADTLHPNGGRASAFDFGSHLIQQVGEISDFGLARAVLQNALAFSECGSHQKVFGSSDGDLVENDLRALEPDCAGFDVAVLLRDFGAEAFESFYVQINRASPDSTPAGERNTGASAAGDQRSENQSGGTHRLDEFVGGFRRRQVLAVNGGAVMGASIAEFDIGAHRGEQVARGLNVADLRNVFENDRLIGEQGGGHAGKGGIFGAAHADSAEQRLSAADDELIHE